MCITFDKLDEDIPFIEEPAHRIIDFILKNDKVINIFSEVLLGSSQYKDMNFVNEKIVKRIDRYKSLYLDLEEEIEELKELMWEYFSYIDDMKLDLVLRTNSKHYKSVSSSQRKLDKLRGTLFEVFAEEIIKPRYEEGEFNTGCMVRINGKKIISYYKNDVRKTIDIAGCLNKQGEFYECKLSPDSLTEKAYHYLDLLDNKLAEIDDFNYIVGCLSLGDKKALLDKKSMIETELNITNDQIVLYGLQELLQLKDSPYDNIV